MAETSRMERLAAALVMAAGVALLAAWPGWRLHDQPPSDSYTQDMTRFVAAAETYAQAHAAGEHDGVPVVEPPAGGDVAVVARRFEFWPRLRLRAGQTYHLHVAAQDTVHSVVIAGRELALVPGQVRVVTITASAGLILQCNEYCGLGHNRMRGEIEVVP